MSLFYRLGMGVTVSDVETLQEELQVFTPGDKRHVTSLGLSNLHMLELFPVLLN